MCCRYHNIADRHCCGRDRIYNVTDTSDYGLRMLITPPRKRCRWASGPGYFEASGTYQSAYHKVLRQCLRQWFQPVGLFDCTGDSTDVEQGWWNTDRFREYRYDQNCDPADVVNSTADPDTTTDDENYDGSADGDGDGTFTQTTTVPVQ